MEMEYNISVRLFPSQCQICHQKVLNLHIFFYFEKQVFFKLLCSIPTKTWCKCSCCRKTLMFITKKRQFTSQWYVVIQKRSICLTRDKKMRHNQCRGGRAIVKHLSYWWSASPAALWFGCCPFHAFCFAALAWLNHGVAVLQLRPISTGKLHLLHTCGGFLAALAIVYHCVGFHRVPEHTHRKTS